MLLSYKTLHLEAQQRLQEEGCVVDISSLGRRATAMPAPVRGRVGRECGRCFSDLMIRLQCIDNF